MDRDDLIFSPPELGCVLSLPGPPFGGGTIQDRSPYGRHGTITSATWVLQNGLWVLSFDKIDDTVSITGLDIDTYAASSVVAWFKATTDVTTTQSIFCAAGTEFELTVGKYTASKLEFIIHDTVWKIRDLDVTANAWHCGIGTWDGTNMVLFMDDVESAALAAGAPATSTINYLGASGGTGSWFGGYIALVRVFNFALSTPQKSAIYRQEKRMFGVW